MRMQMSRDFYLPKKPGVVAIKAKDSDAVAYVWDQVDQAGKPRFYAKGFAGKRAKPDFFYYYRAPKIREEKIAQFFKDRAEASLAKAKRREEQKAPHKMEVGTVLYTSWGYDQTNIDYYQVTKILGPRMVEIRQLAALQVDDNQSEGFRGWVGKSIPDIDNFNGDPMRKKVTNGRIRIASYAWANVWDGKPMSWTAYA